MNPRRDPKLPLYPETDADPARPLLVANGFFDRLIRRLAELLGELSAIPVPDGGERLAVVQKIQDYTALPSDSLIVMSCASGNRVLTLPAANARGPGFGWRITVLRIDNIGAATLTVNPQPLDGINGGAVGVGVTIAHGFTFQTFQSNGSDTVWIVG